MTLPAWTFGILGAVIGSFLNVCIDRLPEGKSILSPPSHCPHCRRRLEPLELIPVLSYLLLRGRCRTCGENIPPRVFGVELGTGLLFWLIGHNYGTSWTAFFLCTHASLLITMGVIDLEHQRVLNVLVFPAIAWGLISILFMHLGRPWPWLLGGVIGFTVLFLIALISSGAMGMGDVKLGLYIGLIVGVPEVTLTLFMAFIAGGLMASILLLLKKIGRKDPIAFGPYLALAGIVTLLYGDTILTWWLRRIGL